MEPLRQQVKFTQKIDMHTNYSLKFIISIFECIDTPYSYFQKFMQVLKHPYAAINMHYTCESECLIKVTLEVHNTRYMKEVV